MEVNSLRKPQNPPTWQSEIYRNCRLRNSYRRRMWRLPPLVGLGVGGSGQSVPAWRPLARSLLPMSPHHFDSVSSSPIRQNYRNGFRSVSTTVTTATTTSTKERVLTLCFPFPRFPYSRFYPVVCTRFAVLKSFPPRRPNIEFFAPPFSSRRYNVQSLHQGPHPRPQAWKAQLAPQPVACCD